MADDAAPTPKKAPGARARARAEITAEILAVAHRHLAEVGGAGLSLRAIAREVGMVSSAIYRYFPSRDDLLTRLITDGYRDLADVVASAVEASRTRPTAERLFAAATSVRTWALEVPNVWALLFGTPIPGYSAPDETTEQVRRLVGTLFAVIAEGVTAGEVADGGRFETTRALRSDLADMRALSGLDDGTTLRAMAWWHQLLGHVSFEVFGHLDNTIDDRDAYFAIQMRNATRTLVG